MSAHLGESAALYALGILEENERFEAEKHLAGCDACRRLLAQAEDDVAAMAATQEQYEPPRRWTRRVSSAWLAAAAAIIIVIAAPAQYFWHQNATMHATMADEAQAMARIASTPHRTASFSGMDAKVMYGMDGTWYCVVIRGARAGLRVVWPHDGTQTALGTAEAQGNVAFLYLPKSHRMDRLALMRDGRVVGQAQLVF
jgi:hypothetical protein